MPQLPTFRFTRVRLRHYRSIRSCDVRLHSLNLLVGPNGSGKSNFLDALLFTAQALTDNLDNALRERGGVSEVRRRSTGHPTHFGISLDFEGSESVGTYGFQVAAVKGGDYRVSHEECRVESLAFGSTPATFKFRDGVLVELTGASIQPSVMADRLGLVTLSGFEAFRPVFDGLRSVNVFNFNPEEMRRVQKPDAGELLRPDGSNIASVLERLKREDPVTKGRIEEYLRFIVVGVLGADREAIGAWEQVSFRQEVAGSTAPWTFPASSMSEGTMRALAVLTALFAPSEHVLAPVGVEEPESALHPAAANLLLDALRDASRTRQVLATTHSPELLDSPSISDRDVIAVRSVGGTSRVDRLDATGRKALEESLFTAGEMLRADQLQPELLTEQLGLFA